MVTEEEIAAIVSNWTGVPVTKLQEEDTDVYKRQVCMLCADVCPQKNMSLLDTNKVWINQDNCIHCLACAKACPAKAISLYGEYQTPEYFINQVEEDAIFYSRSEGGLTPVSYTHLIWLGGQSVKSAAIPGI